MSGSNFESYEDRLRQFLKANKVTDDGMMTLVFISIMGEDNYETLKLLTVPDKPSGKSFEGIITVLKEHFAPKKNKRAERYKFNKAMQQSGQSGESTCDFIARLKSLAQTCQFGELNKTLKVSDNSTQDSDVIVDNKNIVSNYKTLILDEFLADQFIVGLNNTKIQQHLLNKDDLTFEEYCQIALNIEMSEKESKEIQPTSFVNKVNSSDKGQSKSSGHRSHSMSRGRDVSKSNSQIILRSKNVVDAVDYIILIHVPQLIGNALYVRRQVTHLLCAKKKRQMVSWAKKLVIPNKSRHIRHIFDHSK